MSGYLIFGCGVFVGFLASLVLFGIFYSVERERLERDYPQGGR